MTDNYPEWALKGLIGMILAFTASWGGWVTLAVMGSPSRAETIGLIETNAPYLRDRSLILGALEDAKQSNEKLTTALNNNTQALTELRTIVKNLTGQIR